VVLGEAVKLDPRWGSHLPVLIRMVELTDGPVLEMGMGAFSTPILHWMCFDRGRTLVSYDNDDGYFKTSRRLQCDFHHIYLVNDWNMTDIERPWGLAFIDHSPAERRIEDIKRLAHYAQYIVVHDTEPENDKHYGYSEIFPLFKFRFDYTKALPHTAVLSNR